MEKAVVRKKKLTSEWLMPLLTAAAVACIMFFLCWPVKVDGISMEENFHTGDRLFISRFLAYSGDFARGDVVVCETDAIGDEKLILKRIIGLPHESVLISGGSVYINGDKLEEEYITSTTYGEMKVQLEAGEYFVMGDNRAVSVDSRMLGPFDKGEIIGKVLCRWFPFDKIGVETSPYKDTGNNENGVK